jgi:hypothetical protein
VIDFWDCAVLPSLEAHAPTSIVEIGVESGRQTRRLVAWAAAHGAVVHAIDPKPELDLDELAREAGEHVVGDHLVMHRELSLRALPTVAPIEMILLDGDHNWYTVVNELRTIDELQADWPLMLAHDVGWPYGRRDMYYDPATVPGEHRHPHRRAGMRRLRSALVDDGKNRKLLNAEHEGGPRNGVLTAIEDFIASTRRDLLLLAQPGPAGLGVLVSPSTLQRNQRLAQVLAGIHDPEYAVSISPLYASRELDHLLPTGMDGPAPDTSQLPESVRDPVQAQLQSARARAAMAERQLEQTQREVRDLKVALDGTRSGGG